MKNMIMMLMIMIKMRMIIQIYIAFVQKTKINFTSPKSGLVVHFKLIGYSLSFIFVRKKSLFR